MRNRKEKLSEEECEKSVGNIRLASKWEGRAENTLFSHWPETVS